MITAWTGHGGNQGTEAEKNANSAKNANVRHAGMVGILLLAAGADRVVPGEEKA